MSDKSTFLAAIAIAAVEGVLIGTGYVELATVLLIAWVCVNLAMIEREM